MVISSGYQAGASIAGLLPSWSMEDTLSPSFQGPCSHFPWEASRKQMSLWAVLRIPALSPEFQLFPQPFHPCTAPVLPGWDSTTKGLNTAPPTHKDPPIFVLNILAVIYKGLPEPGLGIVEVSDCFCLAGTHVWRLQADVRLQGCRDGRISVK